MAMAVGWSDNCYSYREFKVTTKAAITSTPHSTAMRAPGCMQSVLAAEVRRGPALSPAPEEGRHFAVHLFVCAHETFKTRRSIFSRSTENGPAFP